MGFLLQAHRPIGMTWGIGEIAVAIILVAAIIGIVAIACREFGVAIPQWLWQVIGIVVAAFVCIVAVRFLLTM